MSAQTESLMVYRCDVPGCTSLPSLAALPACATCGKLLCPAHDVPERLTWGDGDETKVAVVHRCSDCKQAVPDETRLREVGRELIRVSSGS